MGREGRRRFALLGAVIALLAMPTGVASAIDVTTVPDAPPFGALVPAPDGLLWNVGPSDDGDAPAIGLVRVGANGASRTVLSNLGSSGAALQLLPDGSMGLLAHRFDERIDGWVHDGTALVRIRPGSGAVASVTQLPAAADEATAVAVTPDGAIWFARSCAGRLGRIAPEGRLTYVRLPQAHCRIGAGVAEEGASLAVDPKGALWFANLCTGRIDRVSLAGRVRQWRVPRLDCGGYLGVTTRLSLDPFGGIAWTADVEGLQSSGRIHDGRLRLFDFAGANVFTADGALWRAVPQGIERRDVNGATELFRKPDALWDLSDLVPVHDDGVAVVRGSYWRTDPISDPHVPPTRAFLDGRVVMLRPGGAETAVSLPDGTPDAASQLSAATLALGPDGHFYVREQRVAEEHFVHSSRLLRVRPDGLPAPRTPAARVRAVLGLVGRIAWVQVSCDAAIARFCVGTVRLTGRDVSRAPARFALAGQSRGVVPVTLGGRALRLLREGGKLSATAVVRIDAGTVTRSPVKLGVGQPR